VPLAELRGTDTSARLLASVVAMTLADAKLRPRTADCEEIGLFVGQLHVSPESFAAFGKSIRERGLAHLSASAFTRMVINSATGVCCRLFGFKGPTATLTTGPDSGLTALVLAVNHLVWHNHVSRLLTAAVDEPGESDDYDHGAASILITAQEKSASVSLTGWALAADSETAVAQALARSHRTLDEVLPMVVSGPPASAGLRAVVTATQAIERGESGPFLINDRGVGSAGAAVILETGN